LPRTGSGLTGVRPDRPGKWPLIHPPPPQFAPVKIPFGNRVLTMISVWLEAKGRADSPRFDILAGEAGPGFGRASHVTENRALALAFTAAPAALLWNRQPFAPGGFGTLALRGYCL
jgi:hypothetical protein